jgi:cysteinyl-tRNA synthetase
MSKSLGNTVSIPSMLERYRAPELRYYLVQPHYRSTIEYSEAALAEAVTAYGRIETFVRNVIGRLGAVEPSGFTAEFVAAMNDDLGTPSAMAAVHNVVREGNTALAAGNSAEALAAAGQVRAMMAVLGLDPLSELWSEESTTDAAHRNALSSLVDGLLDEREKARKERNFAVADVVRDRLLAAGIAVEDTPDGPLWTLKDS